MRAMTGAARRRLKCVRALVRVLQRPPGRGAAAALPVVEADVAEISSKKGIGVSEAAAGQRRLGSVCRLSSPVGVLTPPLCQYDLRHRSFSIRSIQRAP